MLLGERLPLKYIKNNKLPDKLRNINRVNPLVYVRAAATHIHIQTMLPINYLRDVDSEGNVMLQHAVLFLVTCCLLNWRERKKKGQKRGKGLTAGESIKKAHLAS